MPLPILSDDVTEGHESPTEQAIQLAGLTGLDPRLSSGDRAHLMCGPRTWAGSLRWA